MKCIRQVVDDRAFEKNYNIEWYLGNGEIQTTSAVLASIENGYVFFRYPSGGIFIVKNEAIRSLECLDKRQTLRGEEMKTVEDIRKAIIEGLFNNPKLGENYIDWHTENYNECGVTIMYKNSNEQFDIVVRRK